MPEKSAEFGIWIWYGSGMGRVGVMGRLTQRTVRVRYLCMPTSFPTGLSMKAAGKPGEMEKTSFTDFVASLDLDEVQMARLYDGGYDNGPD